MFERLSCIMASILLVCAMVESFKGKSYIGAMVTIILAYQVLIFMILVK